VREVELSADALPVAREIHRRMVAAGLGQKSLAALAGVNETYIRDIFKARSLNPKWDQLSKVAAALGCTVSELTNPRPPGVPPETGQFVDDPDELAWLSFWRRLSPAGRGKMLDDAAKNAPTPVRARQPRRR
jgi:transcriptional regulator with XRE-family HTH domain